MRFNLNQSRLLSSIVFLCVFITGMHSSPVNATVFATVFHIQGDVSVKDKTGVIRKLKRGDSVNAGETVIATVASEAVLKTVDSGIVAVRPNTEMLVQKYSAQGKSNDQQMLKLVSGSLRVISGWIGKINPEQHKVVTPGATIGIRGTDHEPYVLPVQAEGAKFTQGTYDKVNRGQTFLDANGASVDIEKGKVGFARDRAAQGKRQRAMLTLLMPVLLDVVPDFYVGGVFEKELDQFSAQADEAAMKALMEVQRLQLNHSENLSLSLETEKDTKISYIAEPTQVSLQTLGSGENCALNQIGLSWLAALDSAVAKRDTNAIVSLFSPDVTVKAIVLASGQSKTLNFDREEMVKSTIASINSLKDYQQRREANVVQLADGVSQKSCNKVIVHSVAVEQGTMNKRPFRFEAHEEYLLEKRDGTWMAVSVTTRQK